MKKIILLLLVTLLLMSGCGKQELEISGDNLATEPASEQETETTAADVKPVAGVQATQPETAQPQQSEAQQVQTEAAQEPTAAAKKSESKGNGQYVFGMIVLFLLSGAGLYFSYLIPKRIAERKRRARARQNTRRAQPQEPRRRAPNPPSEMSERPTFKDGHWV